MTESTAKPTVSGLGLDVDAQAWQRSGDGDGSVEIAFVGRAGDGGPDWVLMRVAGDPAGRVLVYDRNEWECFLDGVRGGEFDDADGGEFDDADGGEFDDADGGEFDDADG